MFLVVLFSFSFLLCQIIGGGQMNYSPVCKECVLNHECLWQSNDDVESCGDVQIYEADQIEGDKK